MKIEWNNETSFSFPLHKNYSVVMSVDEIKYMPDRKGDYEWNVSIGNYMAYIYRKVRENPTPCGWGSSNWKWIL